MRTRHLNLALMTLLAAVGCQQIIGLSDYDIDPKLDGGGKGGAILPQGGEGGDPSRSGSSNGGKGGSGGNSGNTGGSTSQPRGGEGGTVPMMVAGQAGQGEAGTGGVPDKPPIPCDSVACCTKAGGVAAAEELLVTTPPTGCNPMRDYCEPAYGGFEYGTADDGNSPWTEDSSQGFPLVTDGTDEESSPHKGTYLAFLGGVHEETSLLVSLPFKVPDDAGWLVLSGFRFFEIDRADPSVPDNQDRMSFSLWDETDLLELPVFWDNTNPGDVSDWTKFEVSFSAKDHQGQVRYLYALGETDDWSDRDAGSGGAGGAPPDFPASSNYMIDDLSLKVYRCYAP